MRLLDMVVLTRDLPNEGLKSGDIGTIVLVGGGSGGFEIEFTTLSGNIIAVVTVDAHAIRAVAKNEIAHARATQQSA